MPLSDRPQFFPSRDLHVLRGDQPLSLWKLLQVSFSTGPDDTTTVTFDVYKAQHNDVDIELRPVSDFDEVGTKFVISNGSRIEIDQSTGLLAAGAPAPPEPAVHNFVVEARITRNGTAAIPKGPPARIRVHVHQSVARIWMTPSRLSVHRPTATGDSNTNYRFAVRAEFDDGTVADITSTRHYRPDPGDAECFRDSGDEPCFIRLPAALGPGSVRTLTVVTTAAWGNRRAHADVAVLEPWATAAIPNAELVDGHPNVWDGTLKPEKVPNIVFLGSGLRPLDKTGFETVTDSIVHQMKTSRHLAPYSYLATSMNYWRIFMPGTDAGVSVRCEVYSFLKDGQRLSMPVPCPAAPPDTGVQPLNPQLKLAHLLYLFGLPVPADLALVLDKTQQPPKPPGDVDALRALDPSNVDFTPLLDKWRLTKPPLPMLDVMSIDPKLLKSWMHLANRTFIDEVDAFPPMAIGESPSIEFDASGPIAFYGLGRGGIWGEGGPERTAFFRRVSAAPRSGITTSLDDTGNQSPEIGNLWAEDRPGFTFDNRHFLVTIPNMPIEHHLPFGRSQWVFGEGLLLRPYLRQISPPRDLAGLAVKPASGRNALVLDTPAWSSLTMMPEMRDVCAHELGHAFGLGDEYAEAVPVPFPFGEPPNPNVMATSAALKPDRTVMFGSLKWNWHRIRKAAVLTRPVDDRANGRFRVFVAKGAGLQFSPGESVRLRHRDPREALGLAPVTSIVEFVVESIHPNNINDPNDAFSMTIVLKNESIGIDVAPFGAGSLIYQPFAFPPGGFARPYLTLVSPAAERIMTAIGGTMSGKACDSADVKRGRQPIQIPQLSREELTAIAPMLDWTRIVGAYYGGAQDYCGTLHPAGSCFMRTGVDGITLFCAACRFALVDRVDPAQHWRNDLEYEREYLL
jgi:hypothetical protein